MHRRILDSGEFELLINWHTSVPRLVLKTSDGTSLELTEANLSQLLNLLQRGSECLTRRRQDEILEAINASLL